MNDHDSRRPKDRLLKIEDICELVGVNSKAVKRLVDSGDFPPPFFIGQNERWLKTELDRFFLAKSRLSQIRFDPAKHVLVFDPVCKLEKYPDELAEIHPSLLEYTMFERLPCVYFLVNSWVIVYVGQTRHLPLRIAQHQRGSKGTPKKEFDRVLYVAVEESQLDNAEMYYIKLLRPQLNHNCNKERIVLAPVMRP